MVRLVHLLLGWASLLLGAAGAVLPLLPTVPFVILAAFFFARGNPALERWLLEHRRFGPHISAWRSRGAVSRRGKAAALCCFALSAVIGILFLAFPWSLAPAVAAVVGGSWIATRPEA